MGHSRGGLSTKIHLVCDSVGRPFRLKLTGGQEHDVSSAEELLGGLSGGYVLGDKAYDKKGLVEKIRVQGMKAVIPSRSNRKKKRFYDKVVYKLRNRIERCICRLKQFRRVATRYEKTIKNYLSMVLLAASTIWLN